MNKTVEFKSVSFVINTNTNELLVNIDGKLHQLDIYTLIHREEGCGSAREVIKIGHEVGEI